MSDVDDRPAGRELPGSSAPRREQRIRRTSGSSLRLHSSLPTVVYEARMDDGWPMEFISAAVEGLTGYPPSDFLVGGARPFEELILEEDRERVRREIDLAFADGNSFSVEYRIRHRDGSIRHVRDHGFATRSRDGSLVGVEGILLDVSERVSLFEQLLGAQRRETLGRLTGVVAHDFNNFLTAIIGALGLAREEPLGEAASEAVELALNSANRARKLTRQLLAMGRERPAQRRSFDLNERIAELAAFFSQLVGSPVDVELELADGPLVVELDPTHLDQILLNLVVNAREAFARNGTITFRTEARGDVAVLEVSDDGPGIPEAVRERVFDPFFTTKDTGSGLGLSTVRSLVSDAGGTISLVEPSGGGCCFRITFPFAAEASEPVGGEERDGTSVELPDEALVFVIDDDPDVRDVVSRILTKQGHTVRSADGPSAARQLLKWSPRMPDLTLMDVSLPGMSGVELAAEFVAERVDTPILLMSGYPEEELPDAIRDGPHPFLHKPFDAVELLRAISDALRGPGPG